MQRFYNNTKLLSFIFAVHGLLALSFLFYYGFNSTGEGKKFLLEAQSVLRGETEFILKYQLLNLSYLLYLLPFSLLSIHPGVIIIVTHFITLYAYYQFYLFLKSYHNQMVAITWLVGMLLCPLFLYWNFSLYSENLFLSLTLLFISNLFKSKTLINPILFGLLVLFCRPAGFFVILLGSFLKLMAIKKVSLKLSLVIMTLLCLFVFILIFFFVPLHFDGVAKEIMNGSVLCGITKYHVVDFPSNHYTLFSAYSFYISHYGWSDFFMLEFKKAFSFFNITRVHYSVFHNGINFLFSLLFITNLICFVLAFMKKTRGNFNTILFIQLYIILNGLLVMLFFNEWTERYTLVVFPFLFLSNAFLVNHFFSKPNPAI